MTAPTLEHTSITQTGHRDDQWPLVALKALVEKALDACEDAASRWPSCPAPDPMTDQARRRLYEAPTLARQTVSQTQMAIQVSREALGATNAPPPRPAF